MKQKHTDRAEHDQNDCQLLDSRYVQTSPDRKVYACHQNGQESLQIRSSYAYVPRKNDHTQQT